MSYHQVIYVHNEVTIIVLAETENTSLQRSYIESLTVTDTWLQNTSNLQLLATCNL